MLPRDLPQLCRQRIGVCLSNVRANCQQLVAADAEQATAIEYLLETFAGIKDQRVARLMPVTSQYTTAALCV